MIKIIIPLLGFSLLNSAYAESTAYDTATNVMTIPFVQLDNHNYSNVRFICDPEDDYSCKLLGGEPSDCASGLYSINGSTANTFSIHTRSSGGIQFGGILLSNPDGSEFTASWVKSPKDQNPYLTGQDLSQFSDNIAYGIVGGSRHSGFSQGNLITVTGDSTGYSVKRVFSDAAINFTKGENININNNCNSRTGEYTGDIDLFTSNIYSINILNNTDGGIQLSNTAGHDDFTASWDGTEKLLNKYSLASLGSISAGVYQGFAEEDKAFVTDIGNGVVLTAIDAFTGKVSTTAVFIQKK
ncbi:MAG: hypothetical protein V3U87_10365 [Methylococcaceae bacterium]